MTQLEVLQGRMVWLENAIKETAEKSRALAAKPHDDEEFDCRREQLLCYSEQMEYLNRQYRDIRIEIADRQDTPEAASERRRQRIHGRMFAN